MREYGGSSFIAVKVRRSAYRVDFRFKRNTPDYYLVCCHRHVSPQTRKALPMLAKISFRVLSCLLGTKGQNVKERKLSGFGNYVK